jgi:TRAP-type C4-dicarboxylate transport system permease small subunit
MVLSVSIAVFGRFVLQKTPRWTEELGILCLVWLCFLTSAMAIKDGIHIRMTLLDYVLPKRICKVLHCLSYIALLALSIVCMVVGIQAIELTLLTKLPATHLSSAFLYGSVGVAACLSIFMAISRLLKGEW